MRRSARRALCHLMSFLLCLPGGLLAQAGRGGGPPGGTPGAPHGRADGFEAGGAPFTLEAANGFRVRSRGGRFRHAEHVHPGGRGAVESGWGERLDFRYWVSSRAVAIEYGGDLVVRYRFAEDGTLAALQAEIDGAVLSTEIGDRARQAAYGWRDPATLDLSVYEAIDSRLRLRFSDGFLLGLAEIQGALPAGCSTSGLLCAGCIIGWIGNLAALAAACTVGGVPTLGAVCIGAILSNEVVSGACVAACAEAYFECGIQGALGKGDVVDDGCSGPGDPE